MLKRVGVFLICIQVASFAAASVELPTAFDPNSRYRLDYSDLDTVLKGSVLNMGPSTHNRAPRSRSVTGTKINIGNQLPSRFEGNRVMFHLYKPHQVAFLADMRNDLLAVPSKIDLAKLSKDEQLAYWLNLHNAIVLSEIAHLYPISDVELLFDAREPNALYKRRQFSLNGILISLEDIEKHILNNWSDPVVIYGFYMGAIGTPNILNTAYTAADVFEQLKKNAIDFVNSVRGTEVWHSDELRVSSYYARMASAFPNFERDVLAHIKKYAKPSLLDRLYEIENVKPTIENWFIADLYNGRLNHPAGSYPITSIDNLSRFISTDLPDHVVELLRYRNEKNARSRRQQDVGVEEFEDDSR